jgi:transposase
MWGHQCWLRYAPRRFVCASCHSTFVERVAWREPGLAHTLRYAQHIYERTRHQDIAQIAQAEGLSQDTVQGIFERGGKKTLAQRGYPRVKVLCLDEITTHKGHGHYRLVISAPELGLVLDVLADRTKETLTAWFEQRGEAWCAQVETCCADMWDAYHTVAQEKLPNAQRVVDRFHVTKNLTDAVTKARRTIQNQADEETKAVLKGGRWLLVKNRENLSAEEEAQLAQMLAVSPELKTCYELKEAFRTWFAQSADRETAANGLLDWQTKAKATGLRSLQAFVKTLDNWREGILNYFNGRHSNGFAEGVNLKIKMLNRRGFGYRNFAHFRLHILVAFKPISR